MSLKITMMEIKRLKKNILIGLIAPTAYAGLIMVFFIAFSDVIGQMTDLFDNASLQGLLNAFSMDAATFSYILNFYVSYNGIYVLIMGIIFASLLGVHMFSNELKNGTYEFLYGNPISRLNIFISKSLVVVLYLLVLNVIVFLVGFGSIELLKDKSPLIPWMSAENTEILIDRVEDKPDKLLEAFELNDDLFYEVIYSNMQSQFMMIPSDVEVDSEAISDLMTVFILNPDGIFDEILNNIENYMTLYNLDASGEEQFAKLIELQKDNYFGIKDNFSTDSNVVFSLYKENPRPFLDQLVTLEKTNEFKEIFGFADKEFKKIFVHYSLNNFIEFTVVSFVVMLTISFFILMLIIIVPKGRFSSGMAMGVAMLIYMINIMGNITEKASFLKYITPLSYVNMDVMAIDYQTETWSWITLFAICVISILVSAIAFEKSDFIS